MKKLLFISILPFILLGCSVSYSFNGASINYDLTKTIQIKEFINQAPRVYAPLTQEFNLQLQDIFQRNTKLQFTDVNPDLQLEGEIIRYDLTPQSVKKDAYASETRLTMAVRMRFRNNKKPEEDKEETISAYRDFSSDQSLESVEDGLISQLSKEITEQIFNTTMSNW